VTFFDEVITMKSLKWYHHNWSFQSSIIS